MSLYNQFGTNQTKETEGAWVDYDPDENGVAPGFLVARMSKSNKRYTKEMERATKPYRRSIELETLGEGLAQKIEREVFVNVILLDWRNVSDKQGNALPFTKENAHKLFDALPELYEDLTNNARKVTLFRDEAVEDEVKN